MPFELLSTQKEGAITMPGSSVDIAVVGAGIAGLSAARALKRREVDFTLIEASHRIGGRAYTEEVMPGLPLDLGCHWLHSASLNPFVEIAHRHGFHYDSARKRGAVFAYGDWAGADRLDEIENFLDRNHKRMAALPEDGEDRAVVDMTDRDNPWTALLDYRGSIDSSHDTDAVSVRDVLAYRKTGEDWPVKEGFGALIVRCFGDLPVTLNAAVERMNWSGPKVRLVTRRGEFTAKKVIITASTGILEGGDIRFDPPLPDWKNEAISSLPLGNHNRIYLIFDRDVFGEEAPGRVTVLDGDGAPISLDIRPFGYNIVHGMTGGRFADWLERAGEEASADFAMEKLKEAFGASITRHVVRHLVTAWRGDPWVKGAYSAARPGQSHQRGMLARPIDDHLYFAGEACSSNAYATAHGAYLSGIEAADEATASLT